MAPVKKIKSKSGQSSQQQGSLDTWFTKKKKSSITPSSSDSDKTPAISPKRQQKYSLMDTLVKKRISGTIGEDEMSTSATFASGTLTGYNETNGTYQVLLKGDDPKKKKMQETWTASQVEWGITSHQTLGTSIAKQFHNDSSGKIQVFYGKVVDTAEGNSNNPAHFRVLFDDDDVEDYNEKELLQWRTLYEDEHEDAPTIQTKKRSSASALASSKSSSTSKSTNGPFKRSKKRELDMEIDMDEKKDTDGAMVMNSNDGDSASVSSTRRPRRSQKINSYFEGSTIVNSEMEMENDRAGKGNTKKSKVRQGNTPTAKRSSSSSKTKSKPKNKHIDLDSDDYQFEEEENEGSEEDIVMDETDDDSFEDEEPKPKSSRAGKTKGSKAQNKSATAEKKDVPTSRNKKYDDKDQELADRLEKAREGYKPNNNPQKFPKAGPYVDPVGVDPTHGIVEGIIAAQVRKVGKLLQKAIRRSEKDRDIGEMPFPLRLQTACSGTDAPSIALGLVKESLDKIYASGDPDNGDDGANDTRSNRNHHGFDYSHQMSCEIEPFKQAYIGRNFPGVPLFPDITKLTDGETVVDVYGRSQTVPEGNLFIAGTSCKDFSMLKTRDRLDIEDKGTSGETFLAAVEFLEVKQPPVAIFENVDGAPWAKMQEYIRGRIDLSQRNDTKAIKDSKKKGDADNELKFSVNSEGQYVAEEIPRQVGIRAGCIVTGYVKGHHDANNVTPLMSSNPSTNKFITLGKMAKEHGINLNKDTLVLQKKARYCTYLIKLDTKEYGLPQTRNRKYLFIWRSDDPEDDLGTYFQSIMDHLKTPLLFSMDAFLLPPTHDRIRCFREALRSGPGLMVARERAKESDFWNWREANVKDLPLHMVFREKNGLAEKSRWLTGWGIRGRKSVAPGLWPELVDMWNMRRCDLIDCFAGAAIRDATSRDPLHHSFTWDLSQNVTRAPFRSATVGVSGCVTPGGELLLPHKGRTVMGYEKLLLQGIPFSRLLLGPETEVQLSDLAGNAMSVPVICAAMLAAICAPELRREDHKNKLASLSRYALGQKFDSANGAVLAQRGDLHDVDRGTGIQKFPECFVHIAKGLADNAYFSSVLCTCESSGRTTNDPKILECKDCGMGICHDCLGRHQTESHDLKEIGDDVGPDIRPDPNVFERELRSAMPSILRMGEGWENSIDDCKGLESYSFQLQQVDRKKGHMEFTYGAWEDHGSARQVAEIRVAIGRIGTLDPDVGLAVYIKCFAPAIRHKDPFRGSLQDSARLILKFKRNESSSPTCKWEIRGLDKKCTLQIVGSQSCPSQRVQVGLCDVAHKVLKAHKPMKQFIPTFHSRNNMLAYHPKWKTWPQVIDISGDSSDRINGSYRRLKCKQTVVHSALWRRDGTSDGLPPMYIYIRPDVVRSGLDVAVVSQTPSYNDNMEICELKDWIPENSLAESTHKTQAKFLNWDHAPANLNLEIPNPTMVVTNSGSWNQSNSAGSILCEVKELSKDIIQSLLQHSENSHINDSVEMDLVGRSGTANAKRLSILAAPSLLKCAAEGRLPLDLSKWYKLDSSSGFGICETNVPWRPEAKWEEIKGRKGNFMRVYDAEESNAYYHKLLSRPSAFHVMVDKARGKLTLSMNPSVAAHHAASYLVRGRALGDDYAKTLQVDYCLSELSSMGEPNTKEFRVPNSDAYEEASVDGLQLPLYTRQAKALHRMQAIEKGDVHFSEEERSEHLLHGIGWCLIARAAKKSRLRGGVLGDAIGSGKTVVTIALILCGIDKAHTNRSISDRRSSATLIVVPPGLVKQWDDERKKFTKNKLKCITICDTNTLKRYTVKEICDADIVIVPAGIIEEIYITKGAQTRPYTEHLSKKADANKIPSAPKGCSQREAPSIEGTWVRNMASGPEIYVGNNGKQRTRDEQAYYGHCYSEAIKKLRAKTFGESEKGVPLEYFTWERIVIDECHETLVTGKGQETDAADFKARARRGAREFLGVAETNLASRPLVATTGVWGLTGTPLLETEARVTELANLMGGTYLTGSAHHWRKEERESGRDLFLNQQEGTRSREHRCAVQDACHSYVREACQRNRGAKLDVKLKRDQHFVDMSASDGNDFLHAINLVGLRSFSITPDQLGEKASNALNITASSKARHGALSGILDAIQSTEPDTKIIVFANASYGGHKGAKEALTKSGEKFCHISDNNSVHEQNEIISWFRHVDANEEERLRPRILLLSFEQAAGHNLQEACHHVIIYDPMYSGADAVADASVEEQAVGRVMRQGQKSDVTVTRIIVKGPNGERCLDDWICERNLDDEVLRAATSNFD